MRDRRSGGDPGEAGRALAQSRRRRVLALVLSSALGAAALGWSAGRSIESPEEAARDARPPPASPITVPVEQRVLESSVVTRGDVRFAGAVEIGSVTGLREDGTGAPVVTGRVPSAGDDLTEGDVAVEISGRPVLLLAGELPMYRELRPGRSGEDVRQLEEALARLGHLTGEPDTRYDDATEAAVDRLYVATGYQPAGPTGQEEQQLADARAAVTAAETAHRQAEDALAAAREPPPRSAVLAAEGEVEQARLAHDRAEAACAEVDCVNDPAHSDLYADLRAAANRLEVAEAALAELTAPPDTSAEQEAVDRAADELGDARDDLSELQATTGIRVPYGELVFVPSLPREVDEVHVALGDAPSGPMVRLAGTRVRVEVTVSREEAALLDEGRPVSLDEPAAGVETTGTVTAVADSPGTDGAGAGRYAVLITPDGDAADLAGLNLRVTIPVESTDGEVLAVPLAALVTDATGATWVRVARGDAFEDVPVGVGLVADGFVEVRPREAALAVGDPVVVGRRQ